MSGGEPTPMATTSAAATPHGTNALARAANRVISYLNIQRVPHREVGSHRDRWVHREDTPHIYMYIAHTSQGGLSIHHRALTVRYAFHMPCVPYREGCLYTHLLPCKIPHVYTHSVLILQGGVPRQHQGRLAWLPYILHQATVS
jgi:hypothetical protein